MPKRRRAISASWSQYGCSVESMSIARRTAAGTVAACPGSSGRYERSRLMRLCAGSPTIPTRTGTTRRWISVDWPSLTRTEMVLGRRVNVIDTGGAGPPLLFLHGLGGLWQNWLLNIPAFMGSYPRDRAGPAGVRALGDAVGPDLDPGLRAGDRRAVRPAGRRRSRSSSATRWAASSAPSWRWRSRPGVRKLVLISAAGISAENMWREPVMAVGRLMAIGAAAHRREVAAGRQPAAAAPRGAAARRPLPGEAVRAAGDRAGHRRRHAGLRRRPRRRPGLLVPRAAAGDRDRRR